MSLQKWASKDENAPCYPTIYKTINALRRSDPDLVASTRTLTTVRTVGESQYVEPDPSMTAVLRDHTPFGQPATRLGKKMQRQSFELAH